MKDKKFHECKISSNDVILDGLKILGVNHFRILSCVGETAEINLGILVKSLECDSKCHKLEIIDEGEKVEIKLDEFILKGVSSYVITFAENGLLRLNLRLNVCKVKAVFKPVF